MTIDINSARRAQHIGVQIARYGLVLCFLFIGLAKFTPEEAKGIQPLVAHSPLMSWMYSVWSVQGVSNVIGTFELIAAALLVVGTWFALPSLLGGLLSVVTFLSTISFMFSTPGAIIWGHGFPALGGAGQFLVKDVVLFGASLLIAAAAWEDLQAKQPLKLVTQARA